MRNISAWAIRNPVIPLVLFAGLLAMGLLAFMRMDVNLNPDISAPAATVVRLGWRPCNQAAANKPTTNSSWKRSAVSKSARRSASRLPRSAWAPYAPPTTVRAPAMAPASANKRVARGITMESRPDQEAIPARSASGKRTRRVPSPQAAAKASRTAAIRSTPVCAV